MSWLSNLEKSIVSVFEGNGATPVIDNPTTPVQQAVNSLGATAATAVGAVTTAVGTAAVATVNGYLDTQIGAVPTAMADSALEALAATAIGKLSSSSNKTQDEIASALNGFLTAFTAPSKAA